MKNKLSLVLVAGVTVCVCIVPQVCIRAAADALALCARAVVPPLLVFFILTGLLLRLGLAEALQKPLSPVCRTLFGISGGGASAVLLGLVGGYPVGAVCVKTLYQNGSITKTEAERLLAFCNNTGALFVLGTVGSVLLGSVRAGAVLYACHILAALTVGVLFRFYKPHALPAPYKPAVFCAQPLGGALAGSVGAAVESVLTVCGYTVLFSVVLALADMLVPSALLGGVLEITNGCSRIAALPLAQPMQLRLLALCIGFGGGCVQLQLHGILCDTGLSTRTCLWGKVLQAVLSYIYVTLCTGV